MGYTINRTLNWIGAALDRARGQVADGTDPRVVPDVIMPVIDALGWDRWQERILSAANTAPIGDLSVFPAGGTPEWPGAVGVDGVVPEGVLRCIYQVHVEHNDPTSRQIWITKRDRVTQVDIKIPVDVPGTSPTFYPTAATRMILLRPREFITGRVQTLLATAALSLRYAWFDLSPGEYIADLK